MKSIHLMLALCAVAMPLRAADFTVTRTDDPTPDGCRNGIGLGGDDCSLREAVLAANKLPGADRILLDRAVYELSRATSVTTPDGKSGSLWVTDTLEVVGHGATRSRVRWASGAALPHTTIAHRHQIWHANSKTDLTLTGLTVSHGRGEIGGCIRTDVGELSLRNVVVENCIGTWGGAIHVRGAVPLTSSASSVVSLTNTTLRANKADDGGAIYLSGSSTFIADGVQLTGNKAVRNGGAVYATALAAISLSWHPMELVWRSEGSGTRMADNSAGGDGGAFALIGPGYGNIFSIASAAPIVIERNEAVGEGGAISMHRGSVSGVAIPEGIGLTLEQARIYDNAAASGGALMLRGVGALLDRNEFARNSAQSGSGGAIALDFASNSQQQNFVDIERSSFNHNSAAQNGGAIANQCQIVSARDSSFYSNSSVGNGEVISTSGDTFFAHVTTDGHGNPTSGPATLHKNYHTACGAQEFVIANSVISGADNCLGQSGTIASNGGNQYGPYTGNCYYVAGQDAYGNSAAFALSLGTFGGDQSVLGWTSDGIVRPQVNFGRSINCTESDVRGLPRSDGACDAGAFEQQ